MSSMAWNGTEPSRATVSLGHLIFVMGVKGGRKECKRCTLRWKKSVRECCIMRLTARNGSPRLGEFYVGTFHSNARCAEF
jgi:hypothetical protein